MGCCSLLGPFYGYGAGCEVCETPTVEHAEADLQTPLPAAAPLPNISHWRHKHEGSHARASKCPVWSTGWLQLINQWEIVVWVGFDSKRDLEVGYFTAGRSS